ncbi:DUF1615 domain-containing protein [Lysobacter hankyongensis]|uniref:DUF1615 domain-containing protein n=1 Tax=Lysobacter hankyongensis TaxID=1176535 RepID=A0ABP9C2E5_9GAMM
MTDPSPASRPPAWRSARHALFIAILAVGLGGCADTASQRTPEEVRAQLRQLIPASVPDRAGWAADIQGALAALEIEPSPQNLCAVLAVTEQESTYTANPAVPGLGKIAIGEIEARAARYRIPAFVVRGALKLESPNGESWETRIARVRTEKELSDLFEEMIAKVPMGSRLLARANPVRTGGPMQVSIAFAEAHAQERSYPYAVDGSIRHEVFTRRGGMYFGIAHLLGYPAAYDKPLFRFADFNAGRYASRNAAFQNAVAVATGIPLDLDGDLVRYRKGKARGDASATERAVLTLADKLGMTPAQIRDGLEDSHLRRFEDSALYTGVFEIADRRSGKPLPRATLPRIRLHSPKITRKLTTEWFATRVNQRYTRCMAKAKKG